MIVSLENRIASGSLIKYFEGRYSIVKKLNIEYYISNIMKVILFIEYVNTQILHNCHSISPLLQMTPRLLNAKLRSNLRG